MITRAELDAALAVAWDRGYWRGTSHEGPLNGAIVAARNPYLQTSDAEAAE